PAPPAAPPARTPDPRWTTPSGEPRYGAMRPSSDQPTDAPAPDAGPGASRDRAPEPDRAPVGLRRPRTWRTTKADRRTSSSRFRDFTAVSAALSRFWTRFSLMDIDASFLMLFAT
ncbi:hypothetical protein OY671_007403, partial [Metschnikowia pulcherrima]